MTDKKYTLAEAAKILTAKAGKTKTDKKAEASRENGKKGGRPRKPPEPLTN